jgi:hypothetical protein
MHIKFLNILIFSITLGLGKLPYDDVITKNTFKVLVRFQAYILFSCFITNSWKTLILYLNSNITTL